jgi:hypothetical protein
MIRFTCACGQALQAPDDLTGSQVRCPACQQIQVVPESGPPEEREAREDIRVEPPAVWRRPVLASEEDDPPDRGPVRTSRRAVWSLVLGIASFCCNVFTAIPALILGIMALSDIERERGRMVGSGLAIAGIVTSAFGTLMGCPIVVALLLPAVQKVREAAIRTQSQNNLKEMALAMHNYDSATGSLPRASGGPGLHPGLSWRVALLPYLAQSDLYNQFNLDEPWDSPHNKKLLEQMPLVYATPGMQEAPGMTHYRVFVGPTAAFELSKAGDKDKRGRRVTDFIDGTANTFLIVEVEGTVPWTKPDELNYSPKQLLPVLIKNHDGFNAVMADGSVHRIPKDTPEAILRAMITYNGGEQVTPP